jgi:tetratricopeptide (TPR) repeat protein
MSSLQILRIVVASPGDVQAERDALAIVVEELNRGIATDRGLRLELGRWETKEAFKLFQEANKDLRRRVKTKEPELGDACLAFSKVNENDFWKLFEEAEKLAEKYRDKQLQRQFLYVIAAFCGESIIYYSKTGKIDKAQVLYDDLKQLVETHGEEQPELWVVQAKGAVNLIYTYVTANKPDEAQAVYGELRKLAEDDPDESRLRVWQAKGAFDLT